jgi:hypothetical protein
MENSDTDLFTQVNSGWAADGCGETVSPASSGKLIIKVEGRTPTESGTYAVAYQ